MLRLPFAMFLLTALISAVSTGLGDVPPVIGFIVFFSSLGAGIATLALVTFRNDWNGVERRKASSTMIDAAGPLPSDTPPSDISDGMAVNQTS